MNRDCADILCDHRHAVDNAGLLVLPDSISAGLAHFQQTVSAVLSHPGQVFSMAEIYRQVWKEAPLGAEGTVAVHIRHIREKIEINPGEPEYLKVVWGIGYKFEKH